MLARHIKHSETKENQGMIKFLKKKKKKKTRIPSQIGYMKCANAN